MARHARSQRGVALVALMAGVVILGILMSMARPTWEAELQRDLEEEYLFRARQIVQGIERFVKAHNNLYPQNLAILHLEKMIRKMYRDPFDPEGRWNLVMRDQAGGKELLLVPEERLGEYLKRAVIIGVCSRSPDSGFLEYRGKKRYGEWAVYSGDDPDSEMPELGGPAGTSASAGEE